MDAMMPLPGEHPEMMSQHKKCSRNCLSLYGLYLGEYPEVMSWDQRFFPSLGSILYMLPWLAITGLATS